jgi:hypothetical protein
MPTERAASGIVSSDFIPLDAYRVNVSLLYLFQKIAIGYFLERLPRLAKITPHKDEDKAKNQP